MSTIEKNEQIFSRSYSQVEVFEFREVEISPAKPARHAEAQTTLFPSNNQPPLPPPLPPSSRPTTLPNPLPAPLPNLLKCEKQNLEKELVRNDYHFFY